MSLVVSAVAACTPVGLHAASTCAALRAGVSNISELATHMVTGEVLDREPMAGGRVPTEWRDGEPEEEEWPGHERFGLPKPPPLTSLVEPGVERVLELLGIALDEIHDTARIDDVPVDAYGVGTWLLRGGNDFTSDVVRVDGRPCAKVGREERPNPRLEVVT